MALFTRKELVAISDEMNTGGDFSDAVAREWKRLGGDTDYQTVYMELAVYVSKHTTAPKPRCNVYYASRYANVEGRRR